MQQVCDAKNVREWGWTPPSSVARGLRTLIIFISTILKMQWYIW